MQRMTRPLMLCLIALALAACSHKQSSDAPLAYVPADTPFLLGNLKPLDETAQKAVLQRFNAQMPSQVAEFRRVADALDKNGRPHLAGLLRALADEYDGKTLQQLAADDGASLHPHYAVYGVDINPVARFEIADPVKFKAFLDRIEHGYGKPFAQSAIGGQSYRHVQLGDWPLQVAIAVENKQAVAALLPANADGELLRRVLGVDRPERSAQDAQHLATLAKTNGYRPWALGYLDTARLATLLTEPGNPAMQAWYHAADRTDAPLSAPGCRRGFARIAARVPMLSFGVTWLDSKHHASRGDIKLAADIRDAFADFRIPTQVDQHAAFDLVVALPVDKLRSFWIAQADAVAAKPFACPALTGLNAAFAKLHKVLAASMALPTGGLLGLHLSIDRLTIQAGHEMPTISARLLIAATQPDALLALARFVPALAQLQLKHDGKPVPLQLPSNVAAGQPAWAAMTDKAIAIAVGAGEDGKLGAMLHASGGSAGSLYAVYLDGDAYANFIGALYDKAIAVAKAAVEHGNSDGVKRLRTKLENIRAQAARIKRVNAEAHFDEHGLVITETTVHR